MRELSDHLCECGCGGYTSIVTSTAKKSGRIKGEPSRFIWGHSRRDRTPFDVRLLAKRRISERGCWEWTGRTSEGYGALTRERTPVRAHRIAYELWVGPIPEGLDVLHHCDNRLCFNPEHLFLGTNTDNIHDMWAKGRGKLIHKKGMDVPNSKLTDSDVREIRRLGKAGMFQRDIGKRFGVTHPVIGKILRRTAWSHVLDEES